MKRKASAISTPTTQPASVLVSEAEFSDAAAAVAALRSGRTHVAFLPKSPEHQARVSAAVALDAPLIFSNNHNQCVQAAHAVPPPTAAMLEWPAQHWQQWRAYLRPGQCVMNLASGMVNWYEGAAAVESKFASGLILDVQAAVHNTTPDRLRVWNNRMRVTIPKTRTPRTDVPNSIHVEGAHVGEWPPARCDIGMIDGISHERAFTFWSVPAGNMGALAELYARKGGTASHFVLLSAEECEALGATRTRVVWDPTQHLMIFNNNTIHELDNSVCSVSLYHSFYCVDAPPSVRPRTWRAQNIYHPPEFGHCASLQQTLLGGGRVSTCIVGGMWSGVRGGT
jgi:hypothetical protein